MSISRLTVKPITSVALRYGLAFSSIAAALGLSLLLEHYRLPRLFGSLSLLVIALCFWYAGAGPGLWAVVLSCLAMGFFFSPITEVRGPGWESFLIIYVMFGALAGWFSASRRRGEQLLTEARDNLETRVAERTCELKESGPYLAEAQRLSGTGSWAWSPATGDIRYWSEECYRVLGFDPVGPPPQFETFFERIHPDDRAASRERFEKATRERADFKMDYRIVHPNGQTRNIHVVGHPTLNRSGDLLEFVGTVIDVTERLRAEKELQRQNERLELLLEVTNQVVSNLELNDLLHAISASIRRIMQCDCISMALPDPDGTHLRVSILDFPASKGFAHEEAVIPIDGSPAGKVFRSGRPLVLSGDELNQISVEIDPAMAEGYESRCFLPVISRGVVLGTLVLGRLKEQGKAFTPEETEFFTRVASQIAIAVENASAYHQIAELKDKLAQEKLYLEDEIRTDANFEEIVGTSPALRRVLKHVETVAPTDSTVLIYGETGTGTRWSPRLMWVRWNELTGLVSFMPAPNPVRSFVPTLAAPTG